MKWRALVEQKSSRGKFWAAFGLDQILREMWKQFTIKKNVGQNDSGRDAAKVT